MTETAITAAFGVREMLDQNPVIGEARAGARRFWTGREEKLLRERYPQGGVPACLSVLVGRTASAIYNRAGQLGLRATPVLKKNGFPRERWTSNDQIDRLIADVYQRTPKKGDIVRLASTLGRPRWWISRRACRLGCVMPRFKAPSWTEIEDSLIAERAARDPATIVKVLARAGYRRTETAVMVRLKRIGQPSGRNADADHYTANALATLFGVDRKSVASWIIKGWLKAGRRGTDRHDGNGGGEYWIHRREVRRFIVDNVAVIDLRKVEKFWFVDLLARAA